MSRVGKLPVKIPQGVEVNLDGDLLRVKGPKGEIERRIHPKIHLDLDKERLLVSIDESDRDTKALHGLFRALIGNMVTGVSQGFEKILELVGVGYRAEIRDRTAVFNLGYSHPINFELPDGIEMRVEKTRVFLSGFDKELLGKTAAKIRGLRPPEPYKGKGIKYADEIVRKKAGKAGAK